MPLKIFRENDPIALADRDRRNQKLRALGAVFTKTNRIITGDRSIVVRIQSDHQMCEDDYNEGLTKVAGYTKYPIVYINSDRFGDLRDPKVLVQLLGLNYHELSHVKFTPRNKSFVLPEYSEAWCILEDQRIESYFTAQYEPAGKFFTEMFINHVIMDEDAWPLAFFYSYGRSYLPLEIREEFEARFVLPNKIDEVKELINTFKQFVAEDFRYNQSEVVGVLTAFTMLLKEAKQECTGDLQQCGQPDPGSRQVNEDTEREMMQEDKKRREEEEETGEDQSGFWEDEDDENEESEETDGSGEDGNDEGDDSSSGQSDSDDDGESDDEADSGDDDSDSEGDDDSDSRSGSGDDGEEGEGSDGVDDEDGNGAGNSADESDSESTFDDDELLEYMQDIQEAVQEDDAVMDEIRLINAAMDDRSNLDLIDFGLAKSVGQPVGVAEVTEFTNIARHFRKLYAEVEPGWKYGSDVGKLNVGRAMLDPENYEDHFDEWDEGREHDSGLEVFIALDTSISMADDDLHIGASRALWVIKSALDDVGAKTTVVGFDETTTGLYSREMDAPKNMWPVWVDLGGNTVPQESFHLARAVLTESPMPNKLFIIITDGVWANMYRRGGEYVNEDIPALIKSIPGTRLYVGVGDSTTANAKYRGCFDGATNLADPDGLIRLVDETVTRILNTRR